MGNIEGSRRLKEAKGEYDFAVDGGAVGTIVLRASADDALGNDIPAGSVITGGYIEVDTAVTSGGAATLGANSEAAGDIFGAIVVSGAPWSTTGRKSIIPAATGVTSVKTTVRRSLAVTVAVAALTAGKLRVVVFYR
jgi:hypothetical protein